MVVAATLDSALNLRPSTSVREEIVAYARARLAPQQRPPHSRRMSREQYSARFEPLGRMADGARYIHSLGHRDPI
jgi:hypothetical protein